MPSQQAPILFSSGAISVSANNTDFVASMDVSNYRSGTIQETSTGTGTQVVVQFSMDAGTTWVTTILYADIPTGLTSASNLYTSQVTGIFHFDIPSGSGVLMRVRTVAYSSGTVTVVTGLSSLPRTQSAVALTGVRLGSSVVQIASHPGGNDGQTPVDAALLVANIPLLIGGSISTVDRMRGTLQLQSLISSAARTSDLNSADQTNYNHRGIMLILNVSAQSGGSVKLALQLKDIISANYVTVWTATAAQTAVGTYTYCIYPGALDAASWTEKVQMILGARTWRIATSTANGSSITYSVSAEMLL